MQNGDIDGTFDLAATDVEQWSALGNTDVVTARRRSASSC